MIQTWPQDRDCTIDMNDIKIRFSVKYHPHDRFVPYLLFTYCAKWVVFSNPLTNVYKFLISRSGNDCIIKR